MGIAIGGVLALLLIGAVAARAWADQGPASTLDRAYEAYDAGEFGEAIALFKTAAQAGQPEAQYMLGLMHHRGRGVPVSPRLAAHWYEQAAAQHHAPALCNLGILHRDGLRSEDGDAIEPDMVKASESLRRAAYLKNVPGQLAYAAILINANKSRDQLLEGLAFMRLAADAGDPVARDNLAKLRLDDALLAAADETRREIEARIAAAAPPRRPEMAKQPTPTTPAPNAEPAAPAAGPLRLRRVALRDPMVNGEEAVVMLAPADWAFDGQVQWMVNESVLANALWVMTDPRSGASVRSLPFRQFTWSPGHTLPIGANHMGMTVLPPIVKPDEFVERVWAQGLGALPHLRGMQPASVQELPALAEQTLRDWGAPAQAKGYRLRYELMHRGQPWVEELRFALLYAPGIPTIWTVNHCTALRAPRADLDRVAAIANAVSCSGSYTPRWQATHRACFQLLLRNARGVLADSKALAAAAQANREHIAQLQREIEADREASMTARNQAFREALGGVETYSDPYAGKRVELPQGYRAAWVNPRGEYLLSPQPSYDPNLEQPADARDWRPMDRIDPMAQRRGQQP